MKKVYKVNGIITVDGEDLYKADKLWGIFDPAMSMYLMFENLKITNHDPDMKMIRKGLKGNLERRAIDFILAECSEMIFVTEPETIGVSLIETIKKVGIPIEDLSEKSAYMVAIIGYPRHTMMKRSKSTVTLCSEYL